MMASISLPVGDSTACSVMGTTLTPFFRNMDLKATACSRPAGEAGELPYQYLVEGSVGPNSPFEIILVWKFSRFTRKREHAVAFRSMLRRKGIRVVTITEHADDSPTGKLMEAIIESVDEFYSENLAQYVTRGVREAASRGFFLGPKAPFGYRRVKVSDGVEERPTLQVDPATPPVVKEIFESSLRGNGLKEICKELNERGVTNRRKHWYKRDSTIC